MYKVVTTKILRKNTFSVLHVCFGDCFLWKKLYSFETYTLPHPPPPLLFGQATKQTAGNVFFGFPYYMI